MATGAAVKSVETQALCAKGRGRYPCEYATEAANATAGMENSHDESLDLLTARQVKDKRILKLIRSYLEAGIMTAGLVVARKTGTPQGGPLSPLLSNILLTDLDKELERRGHKFSRYADDSQHLRQKQRGRTKGTGLNNGIP